MHTFFFLRKCFAELRRSLYFLFSQYGAVLDVVALKTPKMRGQAFVVFKVKACLCMCVCVCVCSCLLPPRCSLSLSHAQAHTPSIQCASCCHEGHYKCHKCHESVAGFHLLCQNNGGAAFLLLSDSSCPPSLGLFTLVLFFLGCSRILPPCLRLSCFVLSCLVCRGSTTPRQSRLRA